MEPVDYVGGLRRRGWVLVAAVLLGILIAWLTRSVPLGTPGPKRYEASAVILGSTDPNETNLSTLSALTALGPVPLRVAKAVNYQGDPRNLADQVSTSPDQGSGIMWITAQASTPTEAQRLANVFASQLVKYTVVGRNQRSLAETQWIRSQMDRLAKEISVLDQKIGSALPSPSAGSDLLVAQRDAKIQAYGLLVARYQQVTAGSFEPFPLQVIQKAAPGTRVSAAGLLSTVTPTWRLTVAGVLSLVLGLILVLVLERFDRSIRTREGAERSFGLPVLAEIPPSRRADRAAVVKRNGKVSSAGEPLRLLGALLEEGTSRLVGDLRDGNRQRRSQTILVTSPTSAEGKTSIVARLGRAYAEDEKTVLILGCDFQGPGVHRQFGVSNERGLSDALIAEKTSIEQYAVPTAVPNIWVVPSGKPPTNGGGFLGSERMRQILDEARASVDVVLVDSTPLLVSGDAPHLLREIDSVLVVARTGKTTMEDARRTAEILERLDAPVAGVALSGTKG